MRSTGLQTPRACLKAFSHLSKSSMKLVPEPNRQRNPPEVYQ
jgi:hypothetical protein